MENLKKFNLSKIKGKLVRTAAAVTILFTLGSNIDVVSATTLPETPAPIEKNNEVQPINYDEFEIIIEDIESQKTNTNGMTTFSNLENIITSTNYFKQAEVSMETLKNNLDLLSKTYNEGNYTYEIRETTNNLEIEMKDSQKHFVVTIDGSLIKVTKYLKPYAFETNAEVHLEKNVNGFNIESNYELLLDSSNESYKEGKYNVTDEKTKEHLYTVDFKTIELSDGNGYTVSKKTKFADGIGINSEYIFAFGKSEVNINKVQYDSLVAMMATAPNFANVSEFLNMHTKLFNYYLDNNKQISGTNILETIKNSNIFEKTSVLESEIIGAINENTQDLKTELFTVKKPGLNSYKFDSKKSDVRIDMGLNSFELSRSLLPYGEFATTNKIYSNKTTKLSKTIINKIENKDVRGNVYVDGVREEYTNNMGDISLVRTEYKSLDIPNAKTPSQITLYKVEYSFKGVVIGVEYRLASFKDETEITKETYESLKSRFDNITLYSELSQFEFNYSSDFESAMSNKPIGK